MVGSVAPYLDEAVMSAANLRALAGTALHSLLALLQPRLQAVERLLARNVEYLNNNCKARGEASAGC